MTIPDSELKSTSDTDELAERVTAEVFREWYDEREFRQNIENGQPFFNGPSTVKPPRRHSPSSLLQCHRKTTYRQLNAPEETEDPTGIFWIGTRFEEDIALSFLQDAVVRDDEYVSNSLWVDFTVSTDEGELIIKGETDPVIVTPEGEPLLVTEIKTKQSVENIDTPNTHHKAQAHAYMKGLSNEHDRNVSEAILLYGSRETLDIKPFHIEFDPWFWRKTVIGWAAEQTSYRLDGELPTADPEREWECQFCSYQERCGQGSTNHSDIGVVGFIPGYSEYPRKKVVEYLKAHSTAKLTPTLGNKFPELATEYGVYDWTCTACGETYRWDEFEYNDSTDDPPRCPICIERDVPATLRGPLPADQDSSGGEENV